MRDIPFTVSRKHQEQHWRANREGAHPGLVGNRLFKVTGFERTLIKRMADLGVPMFAHEVVRSPERQAELKKAGKSKAGPGQGPHVYGCAVDIVHGVHGWNLSRQQWEVVGHVGKEIPLPCGWKVEWGGDWKFYDPAHWEIVGWRDLRGEIDLGGATAEEIVLRDLVKRLQE